jgi:hypothetical protein
MKLLVDIRNEYDFTQTENEINEYLPKVIVELKEFEINFNKIISYLENETPDLWTELNISLHSKNNLKWFKNLSNYAIKNVNFDVLTYLHSNIFYPELKNEFLKSCNDFFHNLTDQNFPIFEKIYSEKPSYFSTPSFKTINYKLSTQNIEKLLKISHFDEKSLHNQDVFNEIFTYACEAKNFNFIDSLLSKSVKSNVAFDDTSMAYFLLNKIVQSKNKEISQFLLSKIDFTQYNLDEYLEKNNIDKEDYEKYYFLISKDDFDVIKYNLRFQASFSERAENFASIEERRNVFIEKETLLANIKTYEGSSFFKDLDKKMKSNIQEVYSSIKNEEMKLKNYFKNENQNIITLLEMYFTSLNDLLLFNKTHYNIKQFEDNENMIKVAQNNELFPLVVNHFFQSIKISSIKTNPEEFLRLQSQELGNDLIVLNQLIKSTSTELEEKINKEKLMNTIKNKREELQSAEKISTRKKI